LQGTFKDAVRHGKAVEWFENGQKKLQGTFSYGLRHGKAVEWFENGQKKLQGTFKDAVRHGKAVEWFENGQKKSAGAYEYDLPVGKWQEWLADGRQIFDDDLSVKQARKEAESTLNELRLCQRSYFYEWDTFVPIKAVPTSPPGPASRSTVADYLEIKRKSKALLGNHSWGARWDGARLEWLPKSAFCQYEVSAPRPTADFVAEARCDGDGDGTQAIYQATKASKAKLVTPPDVW
jgi:hypothetical protein